MSYSLRMSDEIHDWLADLRDSDPPAALLVGQALAALLAEGAGLGPPVVISLADSLPSEDLREALDQSYQARLEQLQVVRRHVAEAAMLANDIKQHISELDKLAGTHDQAAELRGVLPGVVEAERRLTERSRRMQAKTDAFRIKKEGLKAAYTAAQAQRAVAENIPASIRDADDDMPHEDPQGPSTEAAARLAEITEQIERELRGDASAEGLMELRPGAPGASDIVIIFAVEPAGTALLIAVLEGREAVQDLHREAELVAAAVLRRAQADQAREASARAYDDPQSFLGEFFPDNADKVRLGAAAFVARSHSRRLADERARLGLTRAQVALRMNVSQQKISTIEHAQPEDMQVRILAEYVEALGGRLELIADFGAERVVLR